MVRITVMAIQETYLMKAGNEGIQYLLFKVRETVMQSGEKKMSRFFLFCFVLKPISQDFRAHSLLEDQHVTSLYKKFVSILAKSYFGNVKTLLSHMGFIQMSYCFLNKCAFSPKEILNLC